MGFHSATLRGIMQPLLCCVVPLFLFYERMCST
nr:MAG TPA: hypothetical protein [Caudoviricetes sp.]